MPQTVFITGSSTGIGRASAKLFYEHGWNVVATMRSPEKDQELRKLDPDRMLVLRLDVEDFGTIEPAVIDAIAKFGQIDVLVNNAGFGQSGLFEMVSREQVKRQFDVNVFGMMDVTRAVLPHMRARQSGVVINIGSGCSIFGVPFVSLYTASKFALDGFTEAVSYELASQGIIAKTVIPHGGVKETQFASNSMEVTPTDMSKLPSYGEFMQKTMETFAAASNAGDMTSSDVAQRIWEAATDGKDTLRYYVGGDEGGFTKARYESQSDEEFMAFMRSRFPYFKPQAASN